MQRFQIHPFLRLLFPFILGIIFGINTAFSSMNLVYGLCLLGGLSCLVLFVFQMGKNQQLGKFVFLLLADVFLFLVAWSCCILKNPTKDINSIVHFYSEQSISCIAEVSSIPTITKQKQKLCLQVNTILKRSQQIPVNGNMIAYIPTSMGHLKAGDQILLRTKWHVIESPKNPEAFDYKRYSNDLGIYYRCYPDSISFKKLHAPIDFSIKRLSLQAQQSIVDFINSTDLSKAAKAICNALITGYDADVEQSVIDGFSATGTLHILSVSGMHVGVLYWVLQFLLSLIHKGQRSRLWRFIAISFLLWSFAFICGGEAPVLRAVIMFTLFGFGECIYPYRTKQQLNILLCSAFLLLVFDPYLIRNAGFLLSYLAVLGLIIIHPWLFRKYEPKNKVLKAAWLNTCVSLAATIATLPISLYYFHFFPFWFIPGNLIVVPLTYLIMASIPMLMLFESLAAWIINSLTSFLITFNNCFVHWQPKETFYVSLTCIDVFAIYFIIFCFGCILYYKRFWSYALLLSVISVWQLIQLASDLNARHTNDFTVYYHYKQQAYSYATAGLVNCPDSALMLRIVKPHLQKTSGRYRNTSFNVFLHDSIRFVSINSRDDFSKVNNLLPTHVLLNIQQVPDTSFFENTALKTVLVGTQTDFRTQQQIQRLCYNFGVDFWDIRTKGYYHYLWKE
jgi:competence protein ComEC